MIIFDEAHKLINAARSMYGSELSDISIPEIKASIDSLSVKNETVKSNIKSIARKLASENRHLFKKLLLNSGNNNDSITSTNIDGKHIIIEKDRAKNKSSHRTLPLVGEFHDILSKLKENQQEYRLLCGRSYNTKYLDYICVDEMGNRIKPNFITDNFRNILEKNNLRRIRFHDLRHTAASLLLNAGVSMKEIQEWLGHSDFGTTANIYGHLDVKAKLRSADAMLSTGMKLAVPA